MAAAAGLDDLGVRFAHLTDPRAIAVVEALRPAWLTRPQGIDGVGAGLAFHRYEVVEAYVATDLEVTVSRTTGLIQVGKVVVAHDCGLIINPDGLRNQIEGNVVQAISRTLKEEVQFDARGVTSTVWERNPQFSVYKMQYPVLKFNETPISIETILIDHPEKVAWGAGEPAIGIVGGAIGNAVFHAIGLGMRSLPVLPATCWPHSPPDVKRPRVTIPSSVVSPAARRA
ncbi:MAG: molybdopterin cofactor-binding domain-containing protein [Ilumatobacteraceae bacterium]